jgi:hypothetical protein
MNSLFNIKNINAGIILLHDSNNVKYTIIGSYLDKNNKKIYTFPGGNYLKNSNENSITTAIREFIEEIFNIKISNSKLNDLIEGIKKKKLLFDFNIYQPNKFITYFSDFKLLKYCYENIYNNIFNLSTFLKFRNKNTNQKIIPKDGLDEFIKIHLVKLTYLYENKINIRNISKYILYKIKNYKNIS